MPRVPHERHSRLWTRLDGFKTFCNQQGFLCYCNFLVNVSKRCYETHSPQIQNQFRFEINSSLGPSQASMTSLAVSSRLAGGFLARLGRRRVLGPFPRPLTQAEGPGTRYFGLRRLLPMVTVVSVGGALLKQCATFFGESPIDGLNSSAPD